MTKRIITITNTVPFHHHEDVIELNRKGLYLYVITNSEQQIDYPMISTKQFILGHEFDLREFEVHKLSKTKEICHLEITKTLGTYKRVILNENNKGMSFNISNCFLKKKFIAYKNEFKTDNFLKLCFDYIYVHDSQWFLNHVSGYKKLNLDHKKRVEQMITRGNQINTQLLKLGITELFEVDSERDLMHLMPHAMVLTNGGTGKSSILGNLGTNLDNSSNAGLFGYFNTEKQQFQAGILTKSRLPVIVDEVNELEGKDVLSTINKPLENGCYYYGKANGKDIKFSNQFIFMGNMSDKYNFETFLMTLCKNIITIGRRIGIIIYNNEMEFHWDHKFKKKLINSLPVYRGIYSHILDHYLTHREPVSRLFHNNKSKQIINDFKRKATTIIHGLENSENTLTFLEYHKDNSPNKRIAMMAYMLAIHDNINEILENGIGKSHYSKIVNSYYAHLKQLLDETRDNYTRIVNHINNIDLEAHRANVMLKMQGKLLKYQKVCLEKLQYYKTRQRITYSSITDKGDLKYLIKDLKKYSNSNLINVQKRLHDIGVYIDYSAKDNDYYFVIKNKTVFNQYLVILNAQKPQKDNLSI